MRYLLRTMLIVATVLLLSGTWIVWDNNRPLPPPDRVRLETALEHSIQWLVEHRDTALAASNPMLWRMLQQAGEVSGDARLMELFAAYAARYLEPQPDNIWRPLFYPRSWVPVRFEQIASHPYYNWHFIYAISCDPDLARVPEIVEQNDPGLCTLRLRSPSCRTHQMMGLLLMRRSQCGDQAQLESSIATLQERIHTQLVMDPTVVDVYMQRVLMLVESGAGDRVKPVWLEKLLDAQQPDGGWSPFMPLVPLGGGRSIGTSRLFRFTIAAPRSDFHMTAQGVLLLALLTHPQP